MGYGIRTCIFQKFGIWQLVFASVVDTDVGYEAPGNVSGLTYLLKALLDIEKLFSACYNKKLLLSCTFSLQLLPWLPNHFFSDDIFPIFSRISNTGNLLILSLCKVCSQKD